MEFGGEASRRRPRETKAAREAREAELQRASREAAEALQRAQEEEAAGRARMKEKALLWGPDGEGAFLAGGVCRDCDEQLLGAYARAEADGPTRETAYDPHREAARRALYRILGRHVCKPKPAPVPEPAPASEGEAQPRPEALAPGEVHVLPFVRPEP
jgi:hypothetical protein